MHLVNTERKKPILVTGSHRSGSTWTGRMIAHASSVAYIHEPFNLYHRPGICKARFNHWFPYVCAENESKYLADVADCFRFRYNLFDEIKAVRSAEDAARLVIDASRFFVYRNFAPRRPLIKDPLALFSTEWLANRFDMDVVILIRHPAAFAGSLKKIQWSHPFRHFLDQPLLMEHHLGVFREQLEEFASAEKSIVDQSILLWNMIHYMILKYREQHPGWVYIKHEDLSSDPVLGFQDIYARLGLSFTPAIRKKIEKYSSLKKPDQGAKKLVRDSRANILSWRKRLTDDEINAIRRGTREIANEFYADSEWL